MSVILRVVRTSSFTPKRSSSASMRRPITAGATPSAAAVAVRLPLAATATKDSICLSLGMLNTQELPDCIEKSHESSAYRRLNADLLIE